MRTTSRVILAAAAVGASFAFGTPAAFAQAACAYPFDCPTGGGAGGAGGGGAGGGGSVARPTGGGGSALPVTGGELVLMTTAGAGALAAGTVLVLAGRKRGAKA